jgi:uncharacterized membrane protein YhaH (DUF805 family)
MTDIPAQPGKVPVHYQFRLARLPYFLWSVAALVVMALLVHLTTDLTLQAGAWEDAWQLSISVLPLELLIYVVAYFVLAVGRFHDIGLSGWWSLLLLVPVVNVIVWLYLLFKPGMGRAASFGGAASNKVQPLGNGSAAQHSDKGDALVEQSIKLQHKIDKADAVVEEWMKVAKTRSEEQKSTE